ANEDDRLRAGMAVTAHLQVSEAETVVAVPETALVDEQGLSVVYVQLEGESFARRVVRTGRRDGGYVEISSGLEAGERVVTDGAYFVRLASAGTTMSAGHGHPHPH